MKLKEVIDDLTKLNLGDCEVVNDNGDDIVAAQLTVKVIYKTFGAQRRKFVAIEFEDTPEIEVEQLIRRGVPITRRLSMWAEGVENE